MPSEFEVLVSGFMREQTAGSRVLLLSSVGHGVSSNGLRKS